MSTEKCSVAEQGAYALVADGTTVLIRPARQQDYDAVRDMHAAMSADDLYLRFFTVSKLAPGEEARRVCREPGPDHAALLVVLDGEVVGCGSFECVDTDCGSAEVALAVADGMHGRGIGTLLLEHLVSVARSRGIREFTAQTLAENTPMLRVFADAGLPLNRSFAGDMYEISVALPAGESDAALGAYRDAAAERERSAGVASLRPALAPVSVAVIGATPDLWSAGRTILRNIITGGFAGPVHVVSPGLAELHGMPCLPSVAALPDQVDLAVIAAPAVAVPGIAEDCGRRGVRALLVITSGLDRPTRAALLGACRRHGMRLIGPGSAGVANGGISLNATAAAWHPQPGTVGLALQSGVDEIAVLEQLSQLGIGISSFVSLGDQDDVSGTDMLPWWESDPPTTLAVVSLDSVTNPRKLARAARTTPILSVNSRQVIRQGLFEQAGGIAVAGLGDLLGTAAVLDSQPVPAGYRVAVVSSTTGAGALAADACRDAGLQVATLTHHTQEALRGLLPADATVAGRVVTTNAIAPATFRRCLELAGADPGVDAVLALTAMTATIDLIPEVCAASLEVPMAAAVLDQTETVRLLPGSGENAQAVPAFAHPEYAARALGHAARYGTWRAAAPEPAPDLDGVRQDLAEKLIDGFVAGAPAGGWLPAETIAELLGCYGIPLAEGGAVTTADAAGVEVSIGVRYEQAFGPLVLFGTGTGSAAAGMPVDRSVRLAPLTGRDARELISPVAGARPLPGRLGPAVVDLALEDLLLRVSRLADDLPQIAELELSPVLARPDGARIAGARVRIEVAEPVDAS